MRKILFISLFLSIRSFAQKDSITSFLRGVDIGIAFTPAFYQKHKLISSTGEDYMVFRNHLGYEGGINLTINVLKDKLGINTGLEVAFIPVGVLYYIPKEDFMVDGFPEDIYTLGFGPDLFPYSYKLPFQFNYNFNYKKHSFYWSQK